MERRTWIIFGSSSAVIAVATAAAIRYYRWSAPTVTHVIEERVTSDTETYRHDLYEISSGGGGTRQSVAHAVVTEKD
eukprot:gene6498-7791_t